MKSALSDKETEQEGYGSGGGDEASSPVLGVHFPSLGSPAWVGSPTLTPALSTRGSWLTFHRQEEDEVSLHFLPLVLVSFLSASAGIFLLL